MEAMLADMKERAARADPAKALRVLDDMVPDVLPEVGDEIVGPYVIEGARFESPLVDPTGDGFVEVVSETWIAGVDGVVLGHGPTREAAIEDALDFCDAASNAAQGLDVLQATPALTRLIGLIPLHYVLRDGVTDA